jgi:hypothetical protein
MFPVAATGNVRAMQPFAEAPNAAPAGRRGPIAGIAGSIAGAATGALVACIAGLAAAHVVATACLGSALIGAVAGAMLALVPAGAEGPPFALTDHAPGSSQRVVLWLGAETEDHH